MQTFKRNVVEVKTDKLSNFHRYFNHFDFKGIVQDKNVFDIDQESFYDATNMYVDDERKLVSRPTLQKDKLPDFIETYLEDSMHSGYTIVDMVNVSAGGVYVFKTPSNYYSFIFVKKDGTSSAALTLEGNITKYNISVIEQYVICFNDIDAKIIDTNNLTAGWQDFSSFVDIPVTKRVVGSTITEPENNAFTQSYKEEYIWSNNSQPELPQTNKLVDVEVSYDSNKLSYQIETAYVATDYRVLRKETINTIDNQYLVSIQNGIMCIAKDGYFLVSYNNGKTFTTVYYPDYSTFLNIASISKDGKYFYFVASDGVYRCDLGTLLWTKDTVINNNTGNISKTGYYNICYFKNDDTYCFLTYDGTVANIYIKAPGIYDTNTSESGKLIEQIPVNMPLLNVADITNANEKQKWIEALRESIVMYYNENTDNTLDTVICILSYPDTAVTNRRLFICNKNYRDSIAAANAGTAGFPHYYSYPHLKSASNIVEPTDTWSYGAIVEIYNYEENRWKTNQVRTEIYGPSISVQSGTKFEQLGDSLEVVPYPTLSELQTIYANNTPYKLAGGYICGSMVYSNINERWIRIDGYLDVSTYEYESVIVNDIDTATNRLVWTEGDKYYILLNQSKLYTNSLNDNDIAVLTYNYPAANDTYNKVPDVSYSDTELYLAFGNTLQITQNDRDGVNIKFNLPKINDQTFISDINGMINISTTEVALFFEDKIVICTKVQDENMEAGYRYDYYNTKLSVGIRKGDSVINTLEGSYTIFPTRRGLSVMNYQAFMATTDQIVEYITDDIKEIWTAFYDASTKIHIMQWRNRLMLTNEHKQILLYDLTGKAWWKWEVPINIFNLFTDQLHLRSIYDTQLIFKESSNYYDFGESGNPITIDYSLMSQPLHMNGSNYYKNIKQLVFQFGTDDEEGGEKKRTLLAQIKLYRKKVTIREPEQVQFKVDELRTFVKRFNYWKINELQWALANDRETASPTKLELNGVSIKYEYGEEVR